MDAALEPLLAGSCLLLAMAFQVHTAGSAENSGEIFAAPSSRSSWKQSVVCPQQWCPCEDLQCWEVPEPPATTTLLMGLFLLEGEEEVVLWLFVMEGSFHGDKRIPKIALWQTLSLSAWDSVAVLTFLHCAVAPTLQRPEGQCSPWLIPETWAVPANLQVYSTASLVICTKKEEDSLKLHT